MTYRQTLDYLYSCYPVFQKIGAAAYKADLHNTISLCELCGNPEKKIRTVHIAGTNGKGSSSHFLASVFQEAGYKTGLYTSPHLKDFRERIKVNGKMISKKYVVDFVSKYKSAAEKIKPSFFEFTFVMTLCWFRDQKVDIAIIETGLGGRLDSTNVILPEISLITNIGIDHTQFLGNTLRKIAGEKAGIIKKNTPVIIGESQREIRSVFIQKAKKEKATLIFASDKKIQAKYPSELSGTFQQKNINAVVHTLRELQKKGWKISEKNIRSGIKKVVTNTGLHGRWETLSKNPKIIADIGHNEAGIAEVVKNLKKEKYRQLHFVIGVAGDKDIKNMLNQLPESAQYYFTKANIPRALDEKILAEYAATFHLKGNFYPTVKRAVLAAKKNAKKTDLIFIGGSAFVVAEAI